MALASLSHRTEKPLSSYGLKSQDIVLPGTETLPIAGSWEIKEMFQIKRCQFNRDLETDVPHRAPEPPAHPPARPSILQVFKVTSCQVPWLRGRINELCSILRLLSDVAALYGVLGGLASLAPSPSSSSSAWIKEESSSAFIAK